MSLLDCVSGENMRRSDRSTIERHVPSLTLMYRAINASGAFVVIADIGIVLDREENKIADEWREEYAAQGNVYRCPPYLDTRVIDVRDAAYEGGTA